MKNLNILFSLIFIILIFPWKSIAQIQFERTIGGGGNEYAYCGIQTKEGGYAVAGCTNSFGAGTFDFYIVKLDQSGMMQWNTVIGGYNDDEAYSIIQTTDGNYVITGATNSFGSGNYDFYVVKLNENGNLIWNKTYGGPASDYSYSVIQTHDGGYAVAGYTSSFNVSYGDMFIIKIDTAGNLQWAKTIGGPWYDGATCIIQTSDDGYAIGGYYYYYSAETYDFYIVKLDSKASLQWTRTVGGHGQDVLWSIKQTTDGGYITTGFADSSAGGFHDCYFVKLDSAGGVEWTTTVGGAGDDYASSIIQTPDGGYAAAGQTNSFGSTLKFYLVKLDGNGGLTWAKTIQGTGNGTEGESIIQTQPGGYLGAGFNYLNGQADFFVVKLDSNWNSCGNVVTALSVTGTRANIGSGGTLMSVSPTVSNPSGSISTGGTVSDICDFYGIKLQSTNIPRNYELFQNYPNPFNPSTKIKFSIPNFPLSFENGEGAGPACRSIGAGRGEVVKLAIYDILGCDVAALVNEKLNAGTYEVEWNASNFPSGVYFYKLETIGFSQTKKLVLIK